MPILLAVWRIRQTLWMSGEQRLPIGDVLPGFVIHGLPEGWAPLEAIVLVKSLDDEGRSSFGQIS